LSAALCPYTTLFRSLTVTGVTLSPGAKAEMWGSVEVTSGVMQSHTTLSVKGGDMPRSLSVVGDLKLDAATALSLSVSSSSVFSRSEEHTSELQSREN